MIDMNSLLVVAGVALVLLAFVLLRGAGRAYGVFAALLVLAALIWFGESLLLGVLGTTQSARVVDATERIDYGDGTQLRHVFEVALAATDTASETLRVDAASFDTFVPGADVAVRVFAPESVLAMKKLATQPLNIDTPGWMKYVSILALALWAAFRLSRYRAVVLALIAAVVVAFTATLQPPDAVAPNSRTNATVRAVQAIQINRGGNDEGARYLFAINDQLLLPEALVSAEYVEFEYVPEGRQRPVLAVDVLPAGKAKAGDSIEVAYARHAPRAARSLFSTRAPASAGLSPWLFAAAACGILAGLAWLGRELETRSQA